MPFHIGGQHRTVGTASGDGGQIKAAFARQAARLGRGQDRPFDWGLCRGMMPFDIRPGDAAARACDLGKVDAEVRGQSARDRRSRRHPGRCTGRDRHKPGLCRRCGRCVDRQGFAGAQHPGHGPAHRHFLPFRGRQAGQDAVRRRLNLDGDLVRGDLHHGIANSHRVALPAQPAQQGAGVLVHSQDRHDHFVRHGPSALRPRRTGRAPPRRCRPHWGWSAPPATGQTGPARPWPPDAAPVHPGSRRPRRQ